MLTARARTLITAAVSGATAAVAWTVWGPAYGLSVLAFYVAVRLTVHVMTPEPTRDELDDVNDAVTDAEKAIARMLEHGADDDARTALYTSIESALVRLSVAQAAADRLDEERMDGLQGRLQDVVDKATDAARTS